MAHVPMSAAAARASARRNLQRFAAQIDARAEQIVADHARLEAERQALIDDGVPEGVLLRPLLPGAPSVVLRGSLPTVRVHRGR